MVIGLCGRMGTGKSEALRIFSALGFNVIDCDDVSRLVCHPGERCFEELVSVFGSDIMSADGQLDRSVLAKKCFSSQENTKRLNDITHKHILDHVRCWIKQNAGNCVVAAPLLFESGFDKECDDTLALTAPFETLLKRMNGRFTEDDFRNRLSRQYSDDFLKENCDYVIENSGTLEELYQKISLFIQCVGA